MKKKTLHAVTIVLVAFSLAVVAIGVAKRLPQKPSGSTPKAQPAKDARPLREKAKQSGSYSESQGPKRTRAFEDLGDLVKHSAAVIIGTPQSNTPTLSGDGQSISLAYSVRVEYVYKGALQEGSTVVVSLPGGRLKFNDGSTAEIQTPWLKKMQNGKTYALFLNQDGANGSFITTGDAQGIFEIPTTAGSNVVQSHSGVNGDATRKYHGRSVKAFLQELRQVTKKPLRT